MTALLAHRTPSQQKIKKTVLIDPSIWREVSQIVDDEENFQGSVLHYLIELGLDVYHSSKFSPHNQEPQGGADMPFLYDE